MDLVGVGVELWCLIFNRYQHTLVGLGKHAFILELIKYACP